MPEPELPEPELPEPELPELGVEELVEASTTIVPFMNGWIAQMYANVPAFVNVCEALWPFFKVPVLKLPSLAVAVWSLGPLLVQVTVSPTWIVIAPGVNLKSEIVSAGSPAAARALTFECTRLLPAALAAGNVSFQDLPVAVRPGCLAAATWVRARWRVPARWPCLCGRAARSRDRCSARRWARSAAFACPAASPRVAADASWAATRYTGSGIEAAANTATADLEASKRICCGGRTQLPKTSRPRA